MIVFCAMRAQGNHLGGKLGQISENFKQEIDTWKRHAALKRNTESASFWKILDSAHASIKALEDRVETLENPDKGAS